MGARPLLLVVAMPKKTKRELELEKQVEDLAAQMQTISSNHRRLSHVTGTVVNEMLTDSKTHEQTSRRELSEKAREAKQKEIEQRERLLKTKTQLQDALAELDTHIAQSKDVRFLSCGSNTCSVGCGKPPGKQVRNYLFCSSRSYDADLDDGFHEAAPPAMQSYQAVEEEPVQMEQPLDARSGVSGTQ